MIEQKIEQDLKTAMLAREVEKTETLRGLKSVVLYYKVANNKRDEVLSDEEIIQLLSKESKKRQESADLYDKGGDSERSSKELREKQIIDAYLPEKISSEKIEAIVDEIMSSSSELNMGQIIGHVKQRTAGSADGSEIARIVKEKINK